MGSPEWKPPEVRSGRRSRSGASARRLDAGARTSSAFQCGPRARSTPDFKRFHSGLRPRVAAPPSSRRATSAACPRASKPEARYERRGPRAPFTPHLERSSRRTSSAFHFGPPVLFTQDFGCPSPRTSGALHALLPALFIEQSLRVRPDPAVAGPPFNFDLGKAVLDYAVPARVDRAVGTDLVEAGPERRRVRVLHHHHVVTARS